MSEGMIKWVSINSKRVPVPVPLNTLSDALDWIQDHLLQKEDTITKIVMNDIEIESELIPGIKGRLSGETVLEFQVDTPFDLMVQSIETIRNFCTVLLRGVKQLAVDLWQMEETEANKVLITLNNFQADLALIVELVENSQNIDVRFSEHINRFNEYGQSLGQISLAMEAAIAKSDWKGCARLLLNNLEPAILRLVEDTNVV